MSHAHCANCIHYRTQPYEAKVEGCYEPELMKASQKLAFLDEQQMAGTAWQLNRDGSCQSHEPKLARLPFWKRILSA